MPTIPAFELSYRPQLPTKADYGIGIVGCGGIVNYAHLPAYAAHGLRVLACYDLNAETARKTATDHGIPTVYESLDALLADERLEIVEIAERALAAGKHLLCQKPLAEELPDALPICRAAVWPQGSGQPADALERRR